MASLLTAGKLQEFASNGSFLVGGKLYTYASGTNTPLATYTDSSATTFNTNPVILDSRGEATVWLGSLSYRLVLKDSNDVLIWTQDDINMYDQFSSLPVGTVIESAGEIADPRWLKMNGASYSRLAYPELQAQLPIGVFSLVGGAALGVTPANNVIAANSTYMVAAGATGTSAVAYSTDGGTWSTAGVVTPAGTEVTYLFVAGARFIASDGAANAPLITSTPNGVWTATTGATVIAPGGFAYSPQLGITLLASPGGDKIYALADADTAWTLVKTLNAGDLCSSICWTGTEFMALCANATTVPIYTSSNSTTWSRQVGLNLYPLPTSCVSDGNGTVVLSATPGQYIHVSVDNGAYVTISASPGVGAASPPSAFTSSYFLNDMFVLMFSGGEDLMSKDGIKWQSMNNIATGVFNTSAKAAFFKSKYYFVAESTAWQNQYDSSVFRVPVSVASVYGNRWPQWIKAK